MMQALDSLSEAERDLVTSLNETVIFSFSVRIGKLFVRLRDSFLFRKTQKRETRMKTIFSEMVSFDQKLINFSFI